MSDTITPVSVSAPTAPRALPEQFADLAPFADWIFDTWRPRYEKRLASTMDQMQAFYDAILPRMADIIEYCNRFDLDDLPDDARNLLLLTFAFCEASFPVEAWRQPRVPDSGAADIVLVSEPVL
jgi:hypothetical protein